MLEAVGSFVVTAVLPRVDAVAGGVSARVQRVGELNASRDVIDLPKAPYVSPYISLDFNYDKAVLQIRDSETGDVVQQFPTESRLAQISRQEAVVEDVAQRVSGNFSDFDLPNAEVRNVTSVPLPVSQFTSADIITIQEAAPPPAPVQHSSIVPPQVAVAALSAGAVSGSVPASSGVSVFV